MKRVLAVLTFTVISLISAPSGAAVTEGDIADSAGFASRCGTGIFNYVVREGHLARTYTDNRQILKQALNSRMRVSVNGDILKVIDRAKMVAVRFNGTDGAEMTGFTTFFFGRGSNPDPDFDPSFDPGSWDGCE
jgi:hypothetical protein